MADNGLTYAGAGVDIDAAQRSLRSVTDAVKATYTDRVMGGIGGFGALFDARFPEMERPVLVSSIDGIGTKTKVAAMAGDYSSLGHDIVNHCVNDILCQGARPLFFLDYFGCSRLVGPKFEAVVGGAAQACAEVGCALIGGETAEMPGVYHDDEVDVVGAIVGLVDGERKYPRGLSQPGDKLIGLASVGLHTNGFSLARRALFEVGGLSVRDQVPGTEITLAQALLTPHRCYFGAVYPLLNEESGIRSLAHITGGGLYDNLPRALPGNLRAEIDRHSWTPLPIFDLIRQTGNISDVEMHRTFNMGIGMVLVVDADTSASVVAAINQAGVPAAAIGQLVPGPNDVLIM